ncbi:PrgI family protein [Candidatus Gottesmanbacteria bacterium]|nr:PrgI family protein [Candidatus Gottesmanbacteria bacterium]
MEQHPIPQNVTTFQFRLIGDMTIKQFGYLTGGVVAAYICYRLPLPFFFTWPLAIASGLLGFGLAFVPIEERPMDVWVASFIKNIYSPTQWVWSREVPHISTPPVHTGLAPAAKPTQTVLHDQKQSSLISMLLGAAAAFIASLAPSPKPHQATAAPTSPRVPAPAPAVLRPTPPPETPLVSGAILTQRRSFDLFGWIDGLFGWFNTKPAVSLSPGLSFADALSSKQAPVAVPTCSTAPVGPRSASAGLRPTVPATAHPAPTIAPRAPEQHERVAMLQNQLSDMMRERERLEKELIAMRQRANQPPPPVSPQNLRQASVLMPQAPSSGPTVRIISPGAAVNAGIPRLTTFPNVVTGIIKDHHGNLLSGMLVTVRDKNDIPLRALKTNRLGQFAASTPLPDNTYVVDIEDPKGSYFFDKAQIQLGGAVAPPLEITAKSQREIERNKLAREIFGNNPM